MSRKRQILKCLL